MPVIRRRSPAVIRAPFNTAGPNRWIPKIRTIIGKSVISAGVVICIHPPHPVVAAVVAAPKVIKAVSYDGLTSRRLITGSVTVIRHAHRVVTPVTSVRPKYTKVVPDYSIRRVPGIVKLTKHEIAPQPLLISSGNVLIACVSSTETWDTHFSSRGWTTIQNQIDAGYPIYAQPSQLTGQYQEVFDFGSIISNIIIVINWNTTALVGSVSTSTSTLETSTDNITWSAPVVGSSVFAASVRYVRLTMNFVGATDKSLAIYYHLVALLNVHREQDGGQANVFAADVGGTVVSFNKTFKAIDAIVLTPINTVEQTAIYNFAFPVNPTTFKILLYNLAGTRIDGTVTWVARGIF